MALNISFRVCTENNFIKGMIMTKTRMLPLIMFFSAIALFPFSASSYSQTSDGEEYALIIDGDDKSKTRLASIDGFSRTACIAAGNSVRKELKNIRTYCLNKSTGAFFRVKKKSK